MSRIFLAGAAGVIGRRLTPLLLAHGHAVWGTTRSPGNVEFLRKLGVRLVVVDVFDAEALATAVLDAKPEIVMHQLTDLAAVQDPAQRSSALARNAHIREEAQPCYSRAQGRGASADRPERRLGLCTWASTLSRRPSVGSECGGRPVVSARGLEALEGQVLGASPMVEGLVLRFGRLYGPGSGTDTPPSPPGGSRRCGGLCRAARD